MNEALTRQLLLIGIGNEYRHDDGAGLVVAQKINTRLNAADMKSAICVLKHDGEGIALLEAWQGWDTVLLVDAVSSEAAPGTIHRFNAGRLDARCSDVGQELLPPEIFSGSSHLFGVAQAVELAKVLDQLPAHLIIYGIEGGNFSSGTGLSVEVVQAVAITVEHILSIISEFDAR